MLYSAEEVFEYVEQEDVKFIRLAFCDVTGRQKNISIMPEELERAFSYGISFDASAIAGFGGPVGSDLFLHPIPSTLNVLPWRPSRGKVVKMFCHICHPDGSPFAMDSRAILENAVREAAKMGCQVSFGSEFEFYLFKTDENGDPTEEPFDHAGYMDVAPEDKGENVRREICLNLQDMGIQPESSHHEEGPGQNEIDFKYSDALSAADNAVSFRTAVKTIAARSGLWADFSPKPLIDQPGSGFHINLSVSGPEENSQAVMAGILRRVEEMTLFLNPTDQSYRRLGSHKAPRFISWSTDNRSMLIRIPAASGEYKRMELRSPDCTANPYLAFALLIWAGLEGLREKIALPEQCDVNLYTLREKEAAQLKALPLSRSAAAAAAGDSAFLRAHLPQALIDHYCRGAH